MAWYTKQRVGHGACHLATPRVHDQRAVHCSRVICDISEDSGKYKGQVGVNSKKDADGLLSLSSSSLGKRQARPPSLRVLNPGQSYTYKQLRSLFSAEQLKSELLSRGLPYLGYKSQLAGRLYQALLDEGLALVGEDAAAVDALVVDECEDGERAAGTGILLEDDSESVMSNKTGMQVTFLSTLKAENDIRVASALACRTLQSVWLFECGEDTQRSLIGHTLVDWKRIDRIFVGSMDPESVLGLPGMLCTISASRSKGHEAADIPIHVYGPPGLVAFVSSMLSVSRTYLEMPVILHELTPALTQDSGPVEVLKRSRLYAMKVPPDQLNPYGYYDGELSAMLKRHTKKRSGGGSDLRAGTLPQKLPPPGDPRRAGSVPLGEMTWTIRADSEWIVTAVPLKNDKPCLGFKATESDRSGRLYPAVAQALGVFDSKHYAELKSGRSVVVEDGSVVGPDQCVGPIRPGRTVGIIPPCLDSMSIFAKKMGPVDVLVHSMTTRLSKDGQLVSLAAMAGACAKELDAKELVLWQSQTSFLDCEESKDDQFPIDVVEKASEAYGDDGLVVLAGSFAAHQWDREGGGISSDEENPSIPLQIPDNLKHLVI